jgi:hypothetical protein
MLKKTIIINILFFILSVSLFASNFFTSQDESEITSLFDLNNIKRVALVGAIKYPTNMNMTGLDYLMDEINNELIKFNNNKYEIVIRNRNELTKMFDELKFQTDDVINENSATAFGNLLGVDAIVYLNIYHGRMNIRFINVETGKMIWSQMKTFSSQYQELLFPDFLLPFYIQKIWTPSPTRQIQILQIIKIGLIVVGFIFIVIGISAAIRGVSSEKKIGCLFFIIGLTGCIVGYII